VHYLEMSESLRTLHPLDVWLQFLCCLVVLASEIGLYQVPSITSVLPNISTRMVGNGFDHAFYLCW
jgi:hypothetical protein